MESTPVIQVKHLAKQFKKETALKDISFSIQAGEIFGFLGPSGAGKTTTIKILTGQLTQSAGQASVLGKAVEQMDESIYQQVGIVTDNSGIYERLSVYQNLAFFARLLGVEKRRIDELLERVGLQDQAKKPAAKLSKGMKQRLILARAILHEPKVLFLDEPTNGLDPSTAEAVHTLLLELKQKGTAIFLTTHNMEEATKLCDRIALLNEGLIVESGSPKAICLKFNRKRYYQVVLKDEGELTLPHTAETKAKIDQWVADDRLLSIHSCEPTLEKVFLEVTGRDLV
ncbi:ABC transporter ATP-binding protein [Enterococcus sp. 669A]|uniref:ABC transporter ATP-binding protein n=1 Tax=Candidatus Enterococcus moelleringii TaxID=2815325 RepID=A0ABS3L9B9_9ENTE|nr:ABC transporter ATP-binding protein [Enterococcus sp. 669A]MBO1306223.1 ABC transporter ATP-binding protein [Enterococcus sp. 669A]